ncbi:MAG: hypothetical protein RIE59_05355 [Imperialibacter sp.]
MTNELPEFLRVIDSLNKHQVLYMVGLQLTTMVTAGLQETSIYT